MIEGLSIAAAFLLGLYLGSVGCYLLIRWRSRSLQ